MQRALIKTITYRLSNATFAFLLVWLLTGNIAVGGLVGGIDAIMSTFLYYFHEVIWEGCSGDKNIREKLYSNRKN